MIIQVLYKKKKGVTRNEILQAAGLTSAGGATQKLRELENCDFIREYTSYGERKERLYQLIDPFILFYYHFLERRPKDPQFWIHQAYLRKPGLFILLDSLVFLFKHRLIYLNLLLKPSMRAIYQLLICRFQNHLLNVHSQSQLTLLCFL